MYNSDTDYENVLFVVHMLVELVDTQWYNKREKAKEREYGIK